MRHSLFKHAISSCLIIFITMALPISAFCAKNSNHSEEIQGQIDDFIDEMVQKHQFKADYLENLFSKININADIPKRMDAPYEEKPWYKYKAYFITDKRINNGLKYWEKNQKDLARAEKEFGVPQHVIVALIGVETGYGEFKGNFGVLEALTTLAFNYPKRAKFFKKELEQYLLMTREQKFDPLALKGSRAGAMGIPQFIPSSYRHYAVNFAGNASSDIINNDADAIGSVANYLVKNGWKKDGQISINAKVKGDKFKKLVNTKVKRPKENIQTLRQHGVKPQKKIPDTTLATLIEFDIESGHEYWLGLKNFYVISRYNNHKHYVQAVYELSEILKNKRQTPSKA